MVQIVLIGIAAGAASALLFISIASGSLLSIPLFYLSPLPILIAALGWSHLAGLIAALVAAAAVGGLFGGFQFLSFLVGIALPAWWLGYLALLSRPVPDEGPGTLEWYPVGGLVAWAALLAATVITLVVLTVATDEAALRAALTQTVERLIARFGEPGGVSSTEPPASGFGLLLAAYPERILPAAASLLTTVVTVFVLWLAARVVRISGRLPRPWPDIPAMTFPPFALPALAVALAGCFLLSGLAQVVAIMFAASLLTAYGMLGLAVLHAITRPLGSRRFVLAAVYGAIVLFSWPIVLMAMLGLIDIALDLRRRAAARGGPPPPALPPD